MKSKNELRTNTSITQIKLAFCGAYLNLLLLEKAFMKIKNIPLHQYANYLSQLAFCIELGFKCIIVNADDFEHTHDLEKLFSMTPNVFQKKFESLFPDVNTVKQNLSSIKNIFEDFRYFKFDSVLENYVKEKDESIVNDDITVSWKRVIKLSSFKFLQILLEKIIEYEQFIRDETVKQMSNIDLSDAKSALNQYFDLVKKNQPNIGLVNKDHKSNGIKITDADLDKT
jgi:hypothetical protein